MPLRQSTLDFSSRSTTSLTVLPKLTPEADLSSDAHSLIDHDTIIVDTTDNNHRLPTPSESATDISSTGHQRTESAAMAKSRPVRTVSTRKRKSASQEGLDINAEAEQDKNTGVSEETLAAMEHTITRLTSAQTLLDVLGAACRDASPWTPRVDYQEDDSGSVCDSESVITVREESEDETAREERRVAKQAKMHENTKKWEQRRKTAEKNATRRSGRASLTTKTVGLIDMIKDTVFGKGSRHAAERDLWFPRSENRPEHGGTALQGPALKKQRMSGDNVVTEEPIPKTYTVRREKKWLPSGLYAGQPRPLDTRSTENKNKRKSKTLEQPEQEQRENAVLPLPMYAGERLLQYGRDFKLPFDVFSPLPAGQPKPDEWKKVNKNVFVGDAATEWRDSKYIEHSICTCHWRQGCGQDCMNRYMYYECDERNCGCREWHCGNRHFRDLKERTKCGGRYNVGVEVMKTGDRGYGVRSNRTFNPNQIIVEYTGEIITQEECEQRMRTTYKNNECYYLMLFDQNMIIDATRGSIARFVNHSCEPNCRMEKWTVGGKPRMALFAGDRGIMTGEELTYDYNFDPYSQKNVQECRCGAKNCRGVLGPKPKPEAKRNSPEDEATKKKVGKLSGTKRKLSQALDEGVSKANKKRKVPSAKVTSRSLPTKAKASSKSPKRKAPVKKATARKINVPKTTANKKLARSDSKLKGVLVSAKNKAGNMKGRRAASSSSAKGALLSPKQKKSSAKAGVSRTSSLKEKAKSMTKAVRTRGKTITVAA